MKKKVLVTGGSGYIGTHVVKALLDMGHAVTVACMEWEEIDTRAARCPVAIFSGDSDIYEQTGRPDVCIHMAWKDGFVHHSTAHMDQLSDHIIFCRNMMAGGLPILSCMGTMHEVGYWEGAIDENTPCNPKSQYGIAKNAMRQSLMISAAELGCTLHWLRLYYIVGDSAQGNSIFAKLMQAAQAGQTRFPFTSGKNQFDFMPIGELARLIAVASLQTEVTGITNICKGEPESLASCIERFIQEHHLGITLAYGEYPDRPYESPGVWGDRTNLKKILENCTVSEVVRSEKEEMR